jgi:integrase
VRSILQTLRTALNKAVKLRLHDLNPANAVDSPRCERREMRTLSTEQVWKYLDVFDRSEIGAAVAFTIGTGLRRGELLGLRWGDVDLEQGTVRVERSLERRDGSVSGEKKPQLRFKSPKTEKSRRSVAIAGFALDRLRRHRLEQAERFIAAEPVARRARLFVSSAMVNPGFRIHLVELLRGRSGWRGLPRVRLHDLRHSYATLSVEGGVDLTVVSRALGHSSIHTTANIYAHVSPKMIKGAADILDRHVREGKGNA